MLKIENLSFDYGGLPVLEGVSETVEKGSVLSLVGPNGAGKTTLLKCIVRILTPVGGRILVDGRDVHRMPRKEMAKHVGYVPQSMPARFPTTVFETVLAGRRPYIAWRPSPDDLERTARIIEEMDMGNLASRDMDRLSGGQVQKVLLARALAQDTPYLLLDEPTSSLDLRHQLEILELISNLSKIKNRGIMMAMHDLNLSARFSDTILMLHAGRIFCKGSPSEVMTSENIAAIYGVEAQIRKENGYIHIHPVRCIHLPASPASGFPPCPDDVRT